MARNLELVRYTNYHGSVTDKVANSVSRFQKIGGAGDKGLN